MHVRCEEISHRDETAALHGTLTRIKTAFLEIYCNNTD